jgi:tetratricopeptide (TPR) repeat protein
LAFQPGERPEEREAALLELRVLGRLGREKKIAPRVWKEFEQQESVGAAVAALGEGVRERSGAKAALAVMRTSKKVSLDDPRNADLVAAMVEDLAATGSAKEGLKLVDDGLRKHPDAAEFHAVRGRALQLSKAPNEQVRAEFERAIALNDKSARALLGLARLKVASDSREEAIGLYERAIGADESDGTPVHELASLLVALDRPADAEKRLEGLLRDRPYDAAAARALAEIRLARDAHDERGIELARRAVRFGGGPDAQAFLERVDPNAKAAADTASADTADVPD